jgi:hypothetical protein
MNTIRRKNGFILLLVLPIMALFGLVLSVVAANSHSLIVQTRRAELRLKAENACQSGLSWIQQNPRKIEPLISNEPLLLTVEEGPRPVTCRIQRISDMPDGEFLQITGQAADGRFSAEIKRRIPLPVPH